MRIAGGQILMDGVFEETDLSIAEGVIVATGSASGEDVFDASGCIILPGIVDIHGDAFERNIMPRPGVFFDLEIALRETDNQLLTNGITTAFHGVTWSWEPGLRGRDNALQLLSSIAEIRSSLICDTRVHLRHEVYNILDTQDVVSEIEARRVGMVAFNDHMEGIVQATGQKRSKLSKMIERSGLSEDDFVELVNVTYARSGQIAESLEQISLAARRANIPMLSHDDRDDADRTLYRALGCQVSEFPMTEEVARFARDHGEATVFGAPNVVRGGSHTGCPSARYMVQKGLCSVLASDYYYPALFHAPFILDKLDILPLAKAWDLVSLNPARMAGLSDRGTLQAGNKADLLVVELSNRNPVLKAVIASGRLCFHRG